MEGLNKYLKKNRVKLNKIEGFSQQLEKQTRCLQRLVKDEKILTVLEIGFNAGHSSETFLESNPKAIVVSFDLGEHDYTHIGKEYIDAKYPGRHTLILGDSTITVPKYSKENAVIFDLIFIDGGHTFEVANADLHNCKVMAGKDTIVIMDDIVKDGSKIKEYNNGPNEAWEIAKQTGIIRELGQEYYRVGRGQCWGVYLL